MQSWKSLGEYRGNLNPPIELLHHAAQFVSMVSNSYLAHQPDDSQNALHWNSVHGRLEGKWIENPGFRMFLDVRQFTLNLQTINKTHDVPLTGRTKEQVLKSLRVLLESAGIDADRLQPISQFVIPVHAVDEGGIFEKPPEEALLEWANWRTNAQGVLDEIRGNFRWASSVCIWPHHFDTGLYVPVSRDEKGSDTQSIGLGLAIADAGVSEPYFYINHWSQAPISYPTDGLSIRTGYWYEEKWKGFVLPSHEIVSHAPTFQEKIVRDFFKDGVNATLALIFKLPETLFNE